MDHSLESWFEISEETRRAQKLDGSSEPPYKTQPLKILAEKIFGLLLHWRKGTETHL